MPRATRSQDRFAALESRVELMAGEIVELRITVQTCQDAMQVSKAQVAKLRERIARVDPSLSGPNAAHNRRYTFQRRGFKLMGLPDELLRMIVDHVATVDRPGDDEDYLLPSRFEVLDKKSLRSLSTTSKAMYEHVMPAVWRHVVIDSPAALLRLSKGLLSANRSCGPYVHSLECSPLLSYRYPLSSARDILLNLYNKVHGDAALSKDAQQRACNVIQPDRFLSESESDLFTFQALVVIMPHLTALESITAEQNILNVLLKLKSDHILPARVTHLRTSGGQYNEPIHLTLAQMDNLSAKIYSMFTKLHLCSPIQDLFLWEVDADDTSKENFSTEVASLVIDYDYCVQFATGPASATEGFELDLQPVRNLTTLQLTSNGSYRVSPQQTLPFVSYPSTLRSVHIRGKQNEAMALIAGVSHIASVEHLKVEYERDAWKVPQALPPSLKTFKMTMPVTDNLDYISLAMGLKRKLHNGEYPESLTHICLDQHTAEKLNGVANQQSVVGALHGMIYAISPDAGFVVFLVAVLSADTACQERGIKLCGPSISRRLISPSFYETLPYRLLGKVQAKIKATRGAGQGDRVG